MFTGVGVGVGDVKGEGVIQGLTNDGVGVGDAVAPGVGVGLGKYAVKPDTYVKNEKQE
jgi:hypothetical protein